LSGDLQRPIASQKYRSLTDVVRLTLPLQRLVRHSDRPHRLLYSVTVTLSLPGWRRHECPHIRRNISGADAIHSYQMRSELDRGRLGEMDHTGFGGAVTGDSMPGLNASD
jgi:hypothetical protein